MSKSLKDKYTVENVPKRWLPLFWLYGYGLGLLIYLMMYGLSKTLRFEKLKDEEVNSQSNYIYCFWHQDLIGFYTSFIDLKGFDMINHPAWFMKPVHVFSRLCGLENIFYGSTGHSGRAAADQLALSIVNGKNTFIAPDGPLGPIFKLNKGVLHLSKKSGKPVLVLKFNYQKAIRLGGWDRKYFPFPFSKVTVEYSKLLQVSDNNFDSMEEQLRKQLSVT